MAEALGGGGALEDGAPSLGPVEVTGIESIKGMGRHFWKQVLEHGCPRYIP